MKILVTGATGYAGYHAAIAFREAGHQVSGLVRDKTKDRAQELLRYEVQLAEGDLSDPSTYRQYLEDSDVLVHTVLDFEHPQKTDRALFNTLQQVAQNSRPQRQRLFIYTTGCSIYGKRSERVMDETTPANPDHALAFRIEKYTAVKNQSFSKMKDSLLELSAEKIKIIELINRFGMSIDLRDWSSFRQLFTEQVKFDYSSIGEIAGNLAADNIVATARQDLGGFQTTQHLITNHLIKIENDTATANAHVRAIHFLPNEEKDPLLEMGGYYTAGLVSIDSEWKIKSWKFNLLWSRGDLGLFELAKKN